MNESALIQRTKNFAKEIIGFCRILPNNREGRLIGDQLFRSGTSVAANYRAACRGRSKAEFVSKLAIVVEEADELVAIFVASIKTTKSNQKSKIKNQK